MGKKIAEELARAREANRQGNKRRAIHHLKKKKMYEAQLDALATSQLKLQEQVIMLEGSKATSETYGALRSGADAMRRMAKETKIEDVDATMDVINEQTDQMRQVQEALGQPGGSGSISLDSKPLWVEKPMNRQTGLDGPRLIRHLLPLQHPPRLLHLHLSLASRFLYPLNIT